MIGVEVQGCRPEKCSGVGTMRVRRWLIDDNGTLLPVDPATADMWLVMVMLMLMEMEMEMEICRWNHRELVDEAKRKSEEFQIPDEQRMRVGL